MLDALEEEVLEATDPLDEASSSSTGLPSFSLSSIPETDCVSSAVAVGCGGCFSSELLIDNQNKFQRVEQLPNGKYTYHISMCRHVTSVIHCCVGVWWLTVPLWRSPLVPGCQWPWPLPSAPPPVVAHIHLLCLPDARGAERACDHPGYHPGSHRVYHPSSHPGVDCHQILSP